ncbi:MAG: TIGR04149 family rSAM-modified RiPP [Alistipes indistinctus]|nr:TIGR04149 family rSAM-modified RiPP [Alistipes indistinctus]
MKKLQKIKLDKLAGIDLNERGLCRILGGATSDPCQCSCQSAESGGSNTSSNASSNTSGDSHSSCSESTHEIPRLCDYTPPAQDNCNCSPQDAICGPHGGGLY